MGNEDTDLFYHALNYRGASSEHAELFWKELQACVNRMIKAERDAIVSLAAAQGWAMKNEDPFEDAVRDICVMRSNAIAQGREHSERPAGAEG